MGIDDFDKNIQKAANKAIDASVESVLKDHVKASESLKALQDALKEIAQEKPIVLFVDELDRCRPDFAVNMLETIKHTFNVKDVQFVLVTNTQQLRSSINHCYGETVDAQRYLDKFLKYSFSLPQVQDLNIRQKTSVSLSHYKNLVKESNVLKNLELGDDTSSDFEVIEQIIKVNKFSLREVETLVRHLEVYVALSPDNQTHLSNNSVGYRILIVLAIAIYSIKTTLGDDILSQTFDAKEVGNILGKTALPTLPDSTGADTADMICFLICLNNCKNSELFTPKGDESKKKWADHVYYYFGHPYLPNHDRYVSTCEDVLRVLSLRSGLSNR